MQLAMYLFEMDVFEWICHQKDFPLLSARFFFLATHVESEFPDQESKPHPCALQTWSLTTELPGKSCKILADCVFYELTFHETSVFHLTYPSWGHIVVHNIPSLSF